ncbi:MAG: acyl-CoA thioesterase [Planctomycetota bacterium]
MSIKLPITLPADDTNGPRPGLRIPHLLRVRYGETDQMGVVHHAQYINFMECGRTHFMREIGVPYASLEARGYWLVIVDISAKLRAPARYDDELTVTTGVCALRHTSLTFNYEIMRTEDKQLCATGETRLACLAAATRRPTAMPEDLAELMRKCLPLSAPPTETP